MAMLPAGDYTFNKFQHFNAKVTFNGQSVLDDDKPGWYMVVGYAQNPDAFNTIVVYADSKSNAKMQLTNKHPNTQYTAIFVTRQADW